MEVAKPTTLLPPRLDARGGARPPGSWAWVAGSFALGFLPHAVGLRYSDVPEGRPFFAVYAALVVAFWLAVRLGDRLGIGRAAKVRVRL